MQRKLLILLALAVFMSPLAAQDPRPGGGGRGAFRVPDPILFNGPPPPEELLDLVGLDSTQYNAYRVQYVSFMEETRPARDSLLEIRRQMRDAYEAGGQAGGRAGGEKLQKTMGELEKRQKEFDQVLKTVLNATQLKRYESWRKEELARAEREIRERFGGPPR